nr:PREDICTED: protein spinster homolog 3-like [Paralichthys olivaceus]
MILQQDNATSHTARSVREFLHDSNVSVLPWPAKSPYLNPIEHVWDLLDRRVRARAIPPRNVQELASALVEEWGVLPRIQTSFDLSDMSAGFFQTAVFASTPLWSPLFGYLGGRFNQKYILMGGICIYTVTTICSSFLTKSLFWLLVLLRFMAGIGDSAISTMSTQILSVLFSGGQLTTMFCMFASLTASGCGLGLIVGAGITTLTGDWRWALRIIPILNVVGIILVGLLLPNQVRSASYTNGQEVKKKSTYGEDVKYLLKNKSYILSTLAFVAANFSNSAMTVWTSTFMSRARVAQGTQPPCNNLPCDSTDSYIFGAVTILTAFLGGGLGAGSSRQWRDKVPNVVICTAAILGFVLCSFFFIFMASESILVTYIFIGLRGIFIVALHSVAADITLYIVVPTRRALAVAVMFTSTVLGGTSGGSSIIGVVSDAIRNSNPPSDDWSFLSLKYSLLICPCVAVLSGILFIITSFYIVEDKTAVQEWIDENSTQQNPLSEVPGNRARR